MTPTSPVTLSREEADDAKEAIQEALMFCGHFDIRLRAMRSLTRLLDASRAVTETPEGLDVERLRGAFIRAGVVWVLPADLFEETVRVVASEYNTGAGTSSESNTIPDPARSPASPRGAGRLDSQRD